jgi:GT2 family glycosyltransferase
MHSDCIVEDPQWMIEMGRSLLLPKDKNIKMVGPRSDKKNIDKERANDVILKDDFLPLFCAMCHRELFSHIGGFIKNYMKFESEELAYRMNYYGYKQAICGNSYIRHIGGCTYEPLIKENPELQQQIDGNREKVIADLRNLYSGSKPSKAQASITPPTRGGASG